MLFLWHKSSHCLHCLHRVLYILSDLTEELSPHVIWPWVPYRESGTSLVGCHHTHCLPWLLLNWSCFLVSISVIGCEILEVLSAFTRMSPELSIACGSLLISTGRGEKGLWWNLTGINVFPLVPPVSPWRHLFLRDCFPNLVHQNLWESILFYWWIKWSLFS